MNIDVQSAPSAYDLEVYYVTFNPYTAKLIYLNLHPLEVVSLPRPTTFIG